MTLGIDISYDIEWHDNELQEWRSARLNDQKREVLKKMDLYESQGYSCRLIEQTVCRKSITRKEAVASLSW